MHGGQAGTGIPVGQKHSRERRSSVAVGLASMG